MVTSQRDPKEKPQGPDDRSFDRTTELGAASHLKSMGQDAGKPAWVVASENERVKVIQGSIADCDTEALFFLNLKDTEFPATGPVVDAIFDRDDRDRPVNRGRPIYGLILDAVKNIPEAEIVRDEGGGAPYDKAVFPSRPYEVTQVDVEGANWPHLKKIFFGNIGPEGAVLVRRAMGYYDGNEEELLRQGPRAESLFTELRQEVTTLLENLFDTVGKIGVKSVGMPVLTGDRAPSSVFYDVLDKAVREKKPDFDIKVYSLKEGEK